MTVPVSILFLLLSGAAQAAPPASAEGACRMLTAADIAAVQSGRLVETKPTSSDAGGYAISDCFYRLEPFTSSVSLEVTRRGAGPGGQDPAERWQRTFRAEADEKDRDEQEEADRDRPEHRDEIRGIEREKSPPIAVAGVGDEAFWIGNRASGVLYALARDRHAYVRVSVGGAGSEEEKRAKAVELARKAVSRM